MTDQEVEETITVEEVENEILLLEDLKRQKREIEAEIADIEGYLDKAIEKTHVFEMEDARVTATVVRGFTDRFDDHLISSRYKAIWDAITRQSIDKGKYLDAVRTGLITPEMHKQFTHSTPKKTYVVINRESAKESK